MEIEYQMLRGLIKSKDYFMKTASAIEPEMFSGVECRTIFEMVDTYNRKYGKQISADALAVMIEQKKMTDSAFEAVVEVYARLVEDDSPVDVDWLYDESEMHCKKRLMINAVWDSAEALEGDNSSKMTAKELTAVALKMEKATNFSFDNKIGEDYFEDAIARYERYLSDAEKIPCALSTINNFTGGGFAKKALHCFMAGTNQGKTRMMCYLAGEYVRAGYNVLYITLEMSEDEIFKRIDANLFDTPTEDLKGLGGERYLEQIHSLQHKTDGHLVCKQYPTSAAGPGHFKRLLDQLKTKRKINFDVVFVDHMDITISTRFPKAEGYDKGKYVSEELRAMAIEYDFACIAGTQTNREGSNKADADMDAISDSFAKVMTMDSLILLYSDAVMKDAGQQMVRLLKSRFVDLGAVKSQILTVIGKYVRYRDPDNVAGINHNVAAVDKMKTVGNKAKNRLKTGKNSDKVDWSSEVKAKPKDRPKVKQIA